MTVSAPKPETGAQPLPGVGGGALVKEYLKPPGYDYPEGNVLVRYLHACEELGVHANSYVASELLQRARSLWPLPYYKIIGLTLEQKIDAMFDHLDADHSGSLTVDELIASREFIDPTVALDEARHMLAFMDTNDDGMVSREEFQMAMKELFSGVSEEGVNQGVMEVLAYRHSLAHIDEETKFRTLFYHLDTDASGFLDLGEIRMVSLSISAEGDWTTARKQLDFMDGNHDGQIAVEEFVAGMRKITEGMTRNDVENRIQDIINRRGHMYNFCHAYVGTKGVLAVLKAFEDEHDFTGLNFSNCGIRNAECVAIAEFVARRPQITALLLNNNPISHEGGVALEEMLRKNPALTRVEVKETYLSNPRSWTHVEIGPPPCQNDTVIGELASDNRKRKPKSSLDLREHLLSHKEELKTLFYSIANGEGEVEQEALEASLRQWRVLSEWNAVPEQLIQIISPERIFEVAEKTSLTYGEFIAALQTEETVFKVVWMLKNKRTDMKLLFYTLSGKDNKKGTLTLRKLLEGLGTAISEQDWGISLEEASQVLTARLFERSDRVVTDGTPLTWAEFSTGLMRLTTSRPMSR